MANLPPLVVSNAGRFRGKTNDSDGGISKMPAASLPVSPLMIILSPVATILVMPADSEATRFRSTATRSREATAKRLKSRRRRGPRTFGKELQIVRQALLELFSRDNGINQSMLKQKLGGLKSRRQLRLCCVLDHSRSGEPDHRSGFGEDQIADAGIAGHHSRGGWMGEHTDIRQSAFRVIGEGGASFGHLHQAEHALIHARSAAQIGRAH